MTRVPKMLHPRENVCPSASPTERPPRAQEPWAAQVWVRMDVPRPPAERWGSARDEASPMAVGEERSRKPPLCLSFFDGHSP